MVIQKIRFNPKLMSSDHLLILLCFFYLFCIFSSSCALRETISSKLREGKDHGY